MARASERDRYKYGICTNRDKNGEGTPCPKCESKEVQKVRGGQDFVCDECKEPLRMVPPPKEGPNMKLIGGIIAAVVVLGGAGLGIALSGGEKTAKPAEDPDGGIEIVDGATENDGMEVEEVNVADMKFVETAQDMRLKENETKQLNIDCNPGNANESVTWKSGNEAVATVSPSGVVTAVAAGKVTITAVADRSQTKAEIEVVVSDEGGAKVKEPVSGRGTVNLSYGTYTGELKNGKPHGYGTITYNTSCKIVSSKDFIANPGDTFEGEFREGKISGLGYWKHGGNTTAVKP